METTTKTLDSKFKYIERWKNPGSYIGPDHSQFFVGFGTNRDDDALGRSNYKFALSELQKFQTTFIDESGDEIETVQDVRDSHWACGWIEYILVHESNIKALERLEELKKGYDSYPVLDDDSWNEEEEEEREETWKNCGSSMLQDAREWLENVLTVEELHSDEFERIVCDSFYWNSYREGTDVLIADLEDIQQSIKDRSGLKDLSDIETKIMGVK